MDRSELVQILISWVTISFAFSLTAMHAPQFFPAFAASFPIILLTLGVGFIFHELGHRWLARKFGCIAFYRMWWPGLVLALGLAIMSSGRLIFAAPGAVMIGGKRLSLRESGLVALMGPAVNMAAGLFFFLLAFSSNNVVALIGAWGAYVNFFLAAFNLIPFPPLDGEKVLQWSPMVWAVAIGFAGYMVLFGV